MLYILRKTESIPRQSEARFLTAAARARVCIKETGVYFQQVFPLFPGKVCRGDRGDSWVPSVRGGCWSLGSVAVTRGPQHCGLPAAPVSQFSFLSPFSLSPHNSLEQLCSVHKKHFSFLCPVLSQLPWSGRGCVPPRNQAPGPPAARRAGSQRPGLLGLPVLCPRAAVCSEVDAWAPRAPAQSAPLWGPKHTRNLASRSAYLDLSVSASLGSWGFRASVAFGPRLFVGSLRSRVPDLALGARSRPLSPGLRRQPRPNRLSPGDVGFPGPRHWPSGQATLQTWAGFLSPARSRPPPLARSGALNLEARLSTSGDFFFPSFHWAKFPKRCHELGVSTPALGVPWRGGEVGVRTEEGVRDLLYLVSLRPHLS